MHSLPLTDISINEAIPEEEEMDLANEDITSIILTEYPLHINENIFTMSFIHGIKRNVREVINHKNKQPQLHKQHTYFTLLV